MALPLKSLITDEDLDALAAAERLILSDGKRRGILQSLGNIDVQACPGSGKTTLVAAKLMLLAQKWASTHQGICVLSHTNVAKDEIIDRLNRSSFAEARDLLSYPHFIGTIQEFVHRFIALPYLRSSGVSNITVDNEEYVRAARQLLTRNEFSWFRGTLNGLGGEEQQDGFLRETYRRSFTDQSVVNVSATPGAWRRPGNDARAKRELSRLKRYLDERGYFLYRDMYIHAEAALAGDEELSNAVSTRFPLLFMDEMQDTQKFQDELLRRVFPSASENVFIQRFGDPDQAIFHRPGGGEEPNESFNGKGVGDMDFVLSASHRFGADISLKIKGLSFNEVDLETELVGDQVKERLEFCDVDGGFSHTVLVFDDNTRGDVIEAFSDLVAAQFSDGKKQSDRFVVKIVGAVGNEINPDRVELKIGHYWEVYSREKSKAAFKPKSLIEAVRYCKKLGSVEWSGSYNILMSAMLQLFALAGRTDQDGRDFSARTLRSCLEEEGKWRDFRLCVSFLLDPDVEVDREDWGEIGQAMSECFGLAAAAAQEYLEYFEEIEEEADLPPEGVDVPVKLQALPDNAVRHRDGFTIKLSTIHGVKGETHDATLVLETKNHCFDMEVMLPYLVGSLPSDEHQNVNLPTLPNAQRRFKPNQQFLRQLYVAMSRPKHLLCIAIHSDRIAEEIRDVLREKGWSIQRLA